MRAASRGGGSLRLRFEICPRERLALGTVVDCCIHHGDTSYLLELAPGSAYTRRASMVTSSRCCLRGQAKRETVDAGAVLQLAFLSDQLRAEPHFAGQLFHVREIARDVEED